MRTKNRRRSQTFAKFASFFFLRQKVATPLTSATNRRFLRLKIITVTFAALMRPAAKTVITLENYANTLANTELVN